MKVNLFVVGAAKAGTTTVADLLSKSDQVKVANGKEPNYFSDVTRAKGKKGFFWKTESEEDYRKLFLTRGASEQLYYCDASTSYLWDKNSAGRIKEYNPDAKIIIMLRNPVDRCYSHYLNDIREGHVKASFEDCIEAELSCADTETRRWGDDYIYLSIGRYYEQIARYKELFLDGDLKIFVLEDYQRDLQELGREIAGFLGVELREKMGARKNAYSMPRNRFLRALYSNGSVRWIAERAVPRKVRQVARNIAFREEEKPEMHPQTRALLKEYYFTEVEKMERLLERELPWH